MSKTLNIQQYLAKNTLKNLVSEYSLLHKRHSVYPNLVLFKYNQIKSPMAELIVQESRGLILDESNNWSVVAYPFNKFFNYNEPNAHSIDWDSAKIYDKLDGSLTFLYFYNNTWHVSTSGTPDASGKVNDIELSFCDLFWQTFNNLGYCLPSTEDRDKTFIFELTSPHNQIVVQQNKSDLHLIGVRDNISLDEIYPEEYFSKYNWKIVNSSDFKDLNSILDILSEMKGEDGEGYIVRDNKFNRVKMKCADYIIKHNLTEQSDSDLLKIMISAECNEFLSYFPKFKDKISDLDRRLLILKNDIMNTWESLRGIENRKDFASKAKDYYFSGILFSLFSKKIVDFDSFLLGCLDEAKEISDKNMSILMKLLDNIK